MEENFLPFYVVVFINEKNEEYNVFVQANCEMDAKLQAHKKMSDIYTTIGWNNNYQFSNCYLK